VGKPPAQRAKERQREQRVATQQASSAQRRKKLAVWAILVGVGAMTLGTVAAGFLGQQSTSTTPSDDTTADPPDTLAPLVEVVAPEPGETITGETPCPESNGSSPRVTEFENAPPTCIDPDVQYDAIVHTSEGDFSIFLDAVTAPEAVNNFVVLSRYHFYDDTQFFELRPLNFIAGGDPVGDPVGTGGPGYTFDDEIADVGVIYPWGAVAMVNDGPDTNGSRFLIATGEQAAGLPPVYPVFGLVTNGDEANRALQFEGDINTGQPIGQVFIESIDIVERPANPESPTTTAAVE
jgi:cyclophilin family peptidyl-prolyl cis-trans isomerase